jgi:hypothetical protein
MRTGNRRRIGSVAALISLSVLIGIPCFLTYREMQQARRNSALIAAIKRRDTPAAIAALNAGADANATEGEETPSVAHVLRDWWNRARGQKPATVNKKKALILATELASHTEWKVVRAGRYGSPQGVVGERRRVQYQGRRRRYPPHACLVSGAGGGGAIVTRTRREC